MARLAADEMAPAFSFLFASHLFRDKSELFSVLCLAAVHAEPD